MKEKPTQTFLDKLLLTFVRRQQFFYYTFIFVIFAFITVQKVYPKIKKTQDKTFVSFLKFANNWDQGTLNKENYELMQKALKSSPCLLKGVHNDIHQDLLLLQPEFLSADFFKNLETQIPSALDSYSDFAKNTITISKGDFQKGLDQAISLKEKLKYHHDDLYIWNQLRIASLLGKLDHKEEQLTALKEVAQLIKETNNTSLETLFTQDTNVSLKDYIAYLEKPE